MGNEQSNHEFGYDRDGDQQPRTNAPRVPTHKFSIGDVVFIDTGIPVTIHAVHNTTPTKYTVLTPQNDLVEVYETALKGSKKLDRPVQRETDKDDEDDDDGEDDDEDDDDDDGEDDGDNAAAIRHHPCGVCELEYTCACNLTDVAINENYEDDLELALRESQQEADELAAALAASTLDAPESARDVADLEDYTDENSY